jgi:hypothetical protein
VRLWFEWIPKEHQEVHETLSDPRSDLEVAAQRAAAEALDGKLQCLADQSPGGAGGEQVMSGEHVTVVQ